MSNLFEPDDDFRTRAEQFITSDNIDLRSLPDHDRERILEELFVYRAELETQNEELVRAQSELTRIRDHYQGLYDWAPVGYLSVDRQHIIREANLAACELFGVERVFVNGRPFRHFVDTRHMETVDAQLNQAVADPGMKHSCEFKLGTVSNRQAYVRMEARATERPTGEIRVILIDIEELRHAQEQVNELVRNLERRVTEGTRDAIRKTQQLRALASRMTRMEQRERRRIADELHDYLAQLLVVTGMKIDQARNASQSEEIRDLLAEARESLRETQVYTRTLISEISPAVLFECGLTAALEHLAQQMRKHGLFVFTSFGEDIRIPEDVAVLLHQSARELLFNCLKHGDSARAWLTATMEDDCLVVTVADEGKGANLELLSAADPMKQQFGLFSVRERLEALGGSLEIETAPGEGMTCRMVVPVQEHWLMGAQDDPIARLEEREPGGESVRVLVVDDHKMVRQGLVMLLDTVEGIEVAGEAETGEEALRLVEELRPDVVVMDLNMPGISGIEATRRVKQMDPDICVIGLSIRDDDVAQREMIQAGAFCFVNKGAPIETICDAVFQSCGREAPE